MPNLDFDPFDDLRAYDPEELIDGYKAPQWLDKILDGGEDE